MSATLETAPPEAPPAEVGMRGERMPHLLGLDGLRGLAVIGVLLFHGGFTWAKGGFLGVSTFFTLSGFLITNLLVREFDTASTIALGRFWTRRFRRLLPAALVAIALVGVVWWRIGSPEQLHGLRADMLGALAYMANWRFYFAGTSYADLFSAPSPLQHFWSLAIEEQFYLFFPPIVWGVMKLGGRRLLTWLLVAALVTSVGLEMWLGNNIDRVYYGTDTRAAELLFGCLLAVWWSGRRPRAAGRHARIGSDDGRTLTAIADGFGVVALLTMFAAWVLVEQTSTKLSHGGFPVYALGTTIIIYAATRPGLVSKFLSIPFLRWAGLISYGLYLYHWPIFLVLDKERTGLSTAPLFVVRMAVTLVIALASYFLLEQPIRRGTMIKTGRQLIVAGVSGAVVVAAVAFVVTLDPPQSQIPYANQKLSDFNGAAVDQGGSDSSVVPIAGAPTTVMLLGDSSAVDASPALSAMFRAAGTQNFVSAPYAGWGLTQPGVDLATWMGQAGDLTPDLYVMMAGFWDQDYLAKNGEAAYEKVLDDAVTQLTANGAKVMWIGMVPGGKNIDRPVNDVAKRVAEAHPDQVTYIELDESLHLPDGATVVEAVKGSEEWPRSYSTADGTVVLMRKPDGWHFCPAGAEQVGLAVNAAGVAAGWMPEADPAWVDGTWRTDARYDDPKGGCTVK